MKRILNFAIVALLGLAVCGCSKQKALSVEEAKQQAEQLNGQTVVVEGILKDICPCPESEGKVALLIACPNEAEAQEGCPQANDDANVQANAEANAQTNNEAQDAQAGVKEGANAEAQANANTQANNEAQANADANAQANAGKPYCNGADANKCCNGADADKPCCQDKPCCKNVICIIAQEPINTELVGKKVTVKGTLKITDTCPLSSASPSNDNTDYVKQKADK